MDQQNDRQYTEDDAMKVLLNPDAYRKYKEEQAQVELPSELKEELSNRPIGRSDSEILQYFQYLLDHPEESRFYKEQQFKIDSKTPSDDQPSSGWKVEIPILSIDF